MKTAKSTANAVLIADAILTTDAERINEYLTIKPDATMRDLHNKLDISIVKIRTLRDAGQINLKPSKHNWMVSSPILRRAA